METNNVDSNPYLTLMAEEMAVNMYDLDEAIRFLKCDFPIRTVKEELERVIEYCADNLNVTNDELVKMLKEKCGVVNVKNWLSGKSKLLSKESALKIAFTLQMDSNEASKFLMQSCWLDGFYMRDYNDVIYRYCLDKKMGYEQAEELIKEHSYLDNQPNPDAANEIQSGVRITEYLDRKLKTVSTLDELNHFIEQNQEYFGSFRRQAYEKFMVLYNTEKYYSPYKFGDIPTDEEICKEIAMSIPSLKGRQAIISNVLKKITEDALSRTTLSEIIGKNKNHGKITEVKRKHLILMWLYVNAGNPDYGDDEFLNRDTAFRECIMDINDKLLEPCGMPLLDSRNPFDWIVMNALHYAYFSGGNKDDGDDTVGRINGVMTKLFKRSIEC